jgi:hypothetical protein
VTSPRLVAVVPLVFNGQGCVGDFAWMIEQPTYGRALFVFNDNEEQFLAFLRGEPAGLRRGGGNAVIRPFRATVPPRAAGVPTGRAGRGYDGLSPAVLRVLDRALDHVRELLATDNYDTLYFSRSTSGRTLGTGVFEVAPEVCQYVYDELCGLGDADHAQYGLYIENAYGDE